MLTPEGEALVAFELTTAAITVKVTSSRETSRGMPSLQSSNAESYWYTTRSPTSELAVVVSAGVVVVVATSDRPSASLETVEFSTRKQSSAENWISTRVGEFPHTSPRRNANCTGNP